MRFLKVTPCCVLLGLLVGASDASATVFQVFVSGEFGGQVMINGDIEAPPPGACGIRWTDPDAWYWGAGGIYGTTEMNIPNNGIGVPELSYTGPYDGCGGDPYLFVTPATPGGDPPAGAVVLVVQVLPGDYEWLDAHANPIPEDPTSPPDPPGLCDAAPEFCEIPPSLTEGDPCDIHPDWCSNDRLPSLGVLAVDAGDYILDIDYLLRSGLRSQLRLHLGQLFVGAQASDLFRRMTSQMGSSTEPVHLDYFAVGIGPDLNLGLSHAGACIQAADALVDQSSWTQAQLEDAYAICQLASDRYAAASARVQQLEDATGTPSGPGDITSP